MPGIEETLRTLRDVQGVYGSFVIAGTGALVARDLPAVFDGELFSEVGPRITRLYETFLSGSEELDACMLRYAEHKLYLRKMTWGVIGVLSAISVNMPALRMVANLVIRRIDPDVSTSLRSSFPPAAMETQALVTRSSAPPPVAPVTTRSEPPPPAPPSVPPEAAPASRQVRMYRGRPVVDD